jgi:hypothetical protein
MVGHGRRGAGSITNWKAAARMERSEIRDQRHPAVDGDTLEIRGTEAGYCARSASHAGSRLLAFNFTVHQKPGKIREKRV